MRKSGTVNNIPYHIIQVLYRERNIVNNNMGRIKAGSVKILILFDVFISFY